MAPWLFVDADYWLPLDKKRTVPYNLVFAGTCHGVRMQEFVRILFITKDTRITKGSEDETLDSEIHRNPFFVPFVVK